MSEIKSEHILLIKNMSKEHTIKSFNCRYGFIKSICYITGIFEDCKIIDFYDLYYIFGSINENIIQDNITDTQYEINKYFLTDDFLFLYQIDLVYRRLFDNGIDIFEILPNHFWIKKSDLTPELIKILKNVYEYVKDILSFERFLTYLHIDFYSFYYKLFLILNFVRGKKDEIFNKYHNKMMSKYILYNNIFNHYTEKDFKFIENKLDNEEYYEQIIFDYYNDINKLNNLYTNSPINKKHIIFDNKNYINLECALLINIKYIISYAEKNKFFEYCYEELNHINDDE